MSGEDRDGHLLTVSSHDLLLGLHGERMSSLVSLLLRALNPTLMTPFNPHISQRPHHQIASYWGFEFQHTCIGNGGGNTNISP